MKCFHYAFGIQIMPPLGSSESCTSVVQPTTLGFADHAGDLQKAADNIPPTSSAPTSSTKTKPVIASLTKDHNQSANHAQTAAGGVVLPNEPQVSHKVDEEESSPSTKEKDARAEFFQTPREHDRRLMRHRGEHLDKSTSRHRQRGERRESWSTSRSESNFTCRKDQQSDHRVGPGDDERGRKDRYHRHLSSHDGTRPQRSSSGFVKRGDLREKGKTRYRTEGQLDLRSSGGEKQSAREADNSDEHDSATETAASPNSTCRSTDDTDDIGDTCSVTKRQLQNCQMGVKASDTKNKNGCGDIVENWDMEQSAQHAVQPSCDLDTTSVKEAGVDTDGGEGAVARSKADGHCSTNQSRSLSFDNENVETIELCEGARYVDTHTRLGVHQNHAIDQMQQRADFPSPSDVLKGSNQDEEREFDEEVELDLVLPHLELGAWGGPHQENSATRLHRHIPGSDTEAMDLNGSIPPPKEFLKNTPPKPMANKQLEEGGGGSNGGQRRILENSSLTDFPKSALKGRRRSAADLEWNDGGETPDVRILTGLQRAADVIDQHEALTLDRFRRNCA